MKAKVLQIHWHEKRAIFAVDCEPTYPHRMATAGEDGAVRVSFYRARYSSLTFTALVGQQGRSCWSFSR